jgi:lysophospholipase L1-like esterase
VRALLALLATEAALRGVGAAYAWSRRPASTGESPAAVLCVGDSFTYGIGAPAGESYPSHLERRLAGAGAGVRGRTRVVNAGVPGSNSTQLVDGLEALLTRHRPAVVAVLTGHNDGNTADSHYYLFTAPGSAEDARRRWHHRLSRFRTYKLLRAAAGALRVRRPPASPSLDRTPPPSEGPEAGLAARLDADGMTPARREAALDRFLAEHPSSAYAAARRIRLLMDRKDFDAARREAEGLVRREPGYVPGRLYLARLHWLYRRFGDAFSEWEAALAVDPGNPDARYGLSLRWQVESPRDEVERVRARLLRYNLDRAARAARRHGARFVVLSYPFTDKERNDVRREAARAAGGAYVDVSGAFRDLLRRSPPEEFLAGDEPELMAGHCNGRGYAFLAERVATALAAAGWRDSAQGAEGGGPSPSGAGGPPSSDGI